ARAGKALGVRDGLARRKDNSHRRRDERAGRDERDRERQRPRPPQREPSARQPETQHRQRDDEEGEVVPEHHAEHARHRDLEQEDGARDERDGDLIAQNGPRSGLHAATLALLSYVSLTLSRATMAPFHHSKSRPSGSLSAKKTT